MDPRILPGFRYRVRHVGTERYLFNGRALTLQSIGLGYGKRLTFTGDSLNFNDNYFWSDSDPRGFAFSLDAVQPADRLTIYGNNGVGVIGEVKVERVPGVQEEISSEVGLCLLPPEFIPAVWSQCAGDRKRDKMLLIRFFQTGVTSIRRLSSSQKWSDGHCNHSATWPIYAATRALPASTLLCSTYRSCTHTHMCHMHSLNCTAFLRTGQTK